MLSEIFKAYDVRGLYGRTLTDEIAYKIGKSFVSFLKCSDVVVGYDMRASSPRLARAFAKGANELGADVIDIGMVSTDALYFASGFLKKAAVMFTASHNPGNCNGIKFCRENAIPINHDTGLERIKSIIEKNQYGKKPDKRGKTLKKDILKNFSGHALKFIDYKKLRTSKNQRFFWHRKSKRFSGELKIVADAGNGMAGKIIPLVYKNLPIKIIPLYFKLDGNFPNHPADPSKYENLIELQKIVKEKNCDFGIAFDGDADRIFFVDENGNVVNSSLISSLIIKNILTKNKNKTQKIIHNLVCSHIVPETIKKYNGIPVIERVGHSFIKETMRKTKAVFACEHSAHYYYINNYRADSGIIT